MMRRTMTAALVALAWGTADAQAAAPQVDPGARPVISVAPGVGAYQGVHPADGDTFSVSRGAWSGTGNSYAYQWQRCTADGANCVDIPGATAASLKADSLFGSALRALVTASNADGSTTVRTEPTGQLNDQLAQLTDETRRPVIEGVAEEGSPLTIAPLPFYEGSRPFQLRVVWQRCTERGDCIDLATNTGTYVPAPADVGYSVRAVFWIVNGAGHERGSSAPPVGPVRANTQPPAVVDAPSVIARDPVEGSELVADAGAWSGGRPIAHVFQWLRCDAAGDGCQELPGETVSRYTAAPADVGRRLRVRVTASSAYGESTSLSAPSPLLGAAPPAVAELPVVAGLAKDGQVLAGSRGSFSGTRPMDEAAGWERCDADGAACTAIEGAAADAHTLTAADIGHRLRFRVIARNAGGSAVARSAATAVVQAIAPTPHDLPAVTGVARDEQALEGTLGSWSGSPQIVLARQWVRCADDGGCSPIAGATGTRYDIGAEDVGSRIRLRVTASNFGNAVEALSTATAVVAPSAPRAVVAPAVSGSARDGAVLTAHAGGWKGTGPLVHGFRWERCDGACVVIPGAAEPAYRLTSGDVGRRVRVVVTAAGPGGAGEAASVTTDMVAAVAPAATSAPEVSGVARDGATLTATGATWSGSAPLVTERRWERCDPECAPVAGRTAAQYTLTRADVGVRLRVVERASNAGGQAESASAPTAIVTARAPRPVSAPSVAGTPVDGATLQGDPGAWDGTSEIAFARQWLRCSAGDDPGGCEAIGDATGTGHAVNGDDVGAFLRLRVTAANAAGVATALSQAVGPVTAAAPVSAPGAGPVLTIPGDPDPTTPDVGDRLVVDNGRWAGTVRDLAFAYRWERCDTAGCREVPGRTGAAETVTAEDVGRQLRVVVTATNAAGSAAQATPRLGVTRGSAGAPPPAVATPREAPSTSPAPPSGSPLSAAACQVVAGRRTLRAGGVKLTVPAGTASAAQPLIASLTGTHRAKRVTLRAGAHRVRLVGAGAGRLTGALRPAVLAKAQLLQLVVQPRKGRTGKAGVRLAVKPCQALLTVRLKGRRLSLRVDQRTPIGRVTYTLPGRLAIRPASAKRTPGGQLELRGRSLTLPALPPGTFAATLSVRLASAVRRGAALRFAAITDSTRLKATASVRR